MNTTNKLLIMGLVMLFCPIDTSAQGILGKLAKKGVETLKQTPQKVADALVGSKEEIEASRKKKGDKDETPSGKKGKSPSSGNPNPDGHGTVFIKPMVANGLAIPNGKHRVSRTSTKEYVP